ncbi:hypothetical protein [Myroides odoratimimus]|uniref:hypothetical protein n=1 Tax=Myroides odoratimimus TaxID=76832 RepID=UPI002577E366|nr:hypothetical protein [Myroides odoratimimus]
MKKRLLPVALLLGTFATNAQVGIGTATPNKSAELLIESKDRGLLIPNVALESTKDKVTIRNGNVQSLLLYATKKQGDITPGYYYWDIDKWSRLTADKDIPQIVVNNFEEIVNMDGDKVKNIIKNIIKNTEGNVIYEGDKFYTYVKDGDKIIKQEIKEKLTTIVHDEKTGDYIYYNENSVDRNGNIIGEGVRIKIKETVINKFDDIINNKTVQEHITNYLDGTYVGGNVYYDGDKLTYVTKEGERKEVSIKEVITANESKTAIITVANKQYYVSEEYLIANNDIIPSNVDPLNLSKGIYAIDVVGGVINNFEEIVTKGPITVDGRTFNTINDYIKYVTESKGGFTKIVYDQTTGDVIFQEWNEVTQKFENVDNSKFSTIVKGNETITTLVDNQDGTYTYTSEDGTTTLVDIPSSVVNQFETIVKQPVEVDGRTFNTINDYIKYVTESKGGFTKIVYDQTTGDVIFQEWNEVTQKFENVDNSKFSTIVKGNETITTLVDNQDGTYTYTSEDGTTTLVDIPSSVVNQFETIVKQPVEVDGRTFNTINDYIKYVTESKGGFTKIVYDQTTGDVIFQEWNEVTQKFENVDNSKFSTIVKGNETITTLVDNQDGTYTYTSEDGTTTLVDIPSSVVNQFETIVKQPVEVDGRTFNTINDYIKYVTESKGGFTKIVYDQTTGDVIFQEWNKVTQKFENVDNSKFSTIVKGNETITLLVPNTNGTFTYYNESQIGADGQPKLGETGVTIDPKEVSVSLNTTTNKYEFKNSQGDVIGEIDANANAIVYNDNTTNLGVTNVQEAIEKLLDKITEVAGTTGDLVVSGGLEFLAKTTGIKALLADVTIQVADEGITNDKLGNKAVTSDKLNAGTGENNRVGVADDQGNVIYKTLDEVVKGNETVTLLIPNTNGTFTYYNESQIGADGQPKLGETGVTIDPKEVSVSLNTTTNKYEFKNSQGDVIGEIDTNAKAIAFDNSTNGFTSTNVQEALEELKTKLDGTSDTLVNNNDGTYTHTTVAGDVVVIDANTTKVEVLDGVYTFKNAKGDTITSIDTNAKAIAFDNSANGFTSTNVQEALEELKTKLDGTSDTLVNNNDGTYTHTTVAGDVVVIDANTTKVEVLDGVYTFKNAKGDTITSIDTNAKAIVFDNSNNGFTSTNVQEALEELKTTVDNTKGDLSLAGGLEFITGANGTDKLLADAGIQIADKGITTDKIKPGTDGQILVTEGTGDTATTKWVNKKSATSNTLVTRETAIVSSVNGEKAELILEGDAVLKEGKTVVQAIQGTLVSDTKPSNAQTLIYDQTTQAWIPGTPDVTVDKVVDAKTLTTDGVIVIGTDSNAIATTATKSLLTDVKLNIANNKITTDHIQNGTIKPEDIANAGNNQVLVTDNTGVPTWKNQTDVGEIVTANNGLTKADTNIQLGGLLTKKTAINTTTDNTLALTGLDKKKTQAVNESEGVTQHLLAVDKNGDVIKALKAAMPKFFYMPSVMVPTAESQAQQEGVTYNNTTRTGTIDMYAIYKKQFGSPVMSSTGASALPVLPASELGFHVTYATEGVFTIVSINAEGLMTYKVNDTANVNIGSFINIVFSVNEDN